MSKRFQRTMAAFNSKTIMAKIECNVIELRVEGDAFPVVVSLEEIYRTKRRAVSTNTSELSAAELDRMLTDILGKAPHGTISLPTPPPITARTGNSIIFVFKRVAGSTSLWERMETGEQMTERQMRACGRRERRPVLPLYGVLESGMKGLGHE